MQTLIDQLATQLNQPPLPEDRADTPPAAPRRPAPASPPRKPRQAAAPFGQLALVAEAVEAARMDVYLDPILGLADRKARHFELSVRLRSQAGDEMAPGDYMAVAGGTGLLARIDGAKLARAAEVAQRLKSRGTRAALFSGVAGESLADDNFLGTFGDILTAEDGLGTRLVLSFTQADARAFTSGHWQSVAAMSAIGLRFALEDVVDLDMDFQALKASGFAFVKLDAGVFLDGLPAAGGKIPSADICRYLSSLGLGLIVGGIVEEKDLARILGFGVILGQGALFGGPRSVALERERRAA
jgi:cyclic-di-GMP phosphodiesterase TipF (flagellum assembly factor)